ncbi:hypothetical protein R1flu_026275 [Riccia fluitans]|uniref:Uncharacterized protein n=1 Tax=Riccia fluitans TaxID=41844 RepID=A0ABD1XFH6_9MARC
MRFWEQASGSGAGTREPEGGSYQQLKTALNPMNPSSRKFQESATAMLKNMTPLLQKCRTMSFKKMLMPSVVADRNTQQSELIKWQQEMFHRILNLMCLVEEELTERSELDDFRVGLLRTLTTEHPNGEWADFTRDKLLFLQDLYQSKCISAEEYHEAKRPILMRLADQGAELDSQDFRFNSKELTRNGDSSGLERPTVEIPEAAEADASVEVPSTSESAKKTPIKQVIDQAVARLKSAGSGGKNVPSEEKPRVPHAMDFVRHDPRDCPTREAPIYVRKTQDVADSPTYYDASTGSTRDLLPELSNSIPQEAEVAQSPASAPSSPTIASLLSPPSVSSASLAEQSKSLLKPPRKLTFTPTKSPLVPSKASSLGLTRTQSNIVESSTVGGKLEKSLSRRITGMLGRWQAWQIGGEVEKPQLEKPQGSDEEEDSDDEAAKMPKKTSVWRKFDLLRPASNKSRNDDEDDDFGKGISDKDPLLKAIDSYGAENIKENCIHGQGPNTKKLKKKLAVRAAPTNFFIDNVLGDNIKTELARIRSEMARSNPVEQAFTNDQIEAIATRLPVDKTELMRFFPKSWCDRYGDIVLEVVHKEFNSHVSEMDGLRKAAKEKKASPGVLQPAVAEENDENKAAEFQSPSDDKPPSVKTTPHRSTTTPPSTKTVLSKCYTTHGYELKTSSVHRQRETSSPLGTPGGRARRGLGFENDLDVKLEAEILRMPFRNFNNTSNVRS